MGKYRKNFVYSTEGKKIGENMSYILGDDPVGILFQDKKAETFQIVGDGLKQLDYEIKVQTVNISKLKYNIFVLCRQKYLQS